MDRNLLIAAIVFVSVLVGGTVMLLREVNRTVTDSRPTTADAVSGILQDINSPQAGNFRLGDVVPDFSFATKEGETKRLSDFLDGEHFVVINFHHPDCPCAEACGALINQLIDEGFDEVRFIGLMSSSWTNPRVVAALNEQIATGAIRFPVFRDVDRTAMALLGATRTPEVWILDKEGRITFWGAPESTLFPGSSAHRYLLREALVAMRKGEEPEIRTFPPIGCPIEDEA